ncbi:hypothetical protein QN372_14425 [Undibacterium sp. RTI2.1]|uniref:BcsR/BcsP family cellulose biosynthesis protein n=1 Tax=unclassified Undibacterium TaxID=2630295 RepID=UPI002AB43C31|nr:MULTISPECIES: BcsR/BcsP family cellulose biosynthesis protein [unclassified Undibacterium]MDY7538500.1 hypothetical protein [Undibacterium sp. 5I1]MEB0031953.1 hypothetical protein [Undibacterium sp. RTI2.1]MEB0114875.1 hypothetical protein [Undibacterium sp. RTI2.2]MEB0231533.1 hypothetical protein [Undibacterium sp. 10I3]MEB0255834.1 hypothetical protein [Undibacterium sp. 5I1]
MENDIKNLFKKIDGKVDSYQEIHSDELNEQAKQRWPLLRDVRAKTATAHPMRNAIARAESVVKAPTMLANNTTYNPQSVNQSIHEGSSSFAGFAPKVPVTSVDNLATAQIKTQPQIPALAPRGNSNGVSGMNVSSAQSTPSISIAASASAPIAARDNSSAPSLHALFDRLAQKVEPEKLPESPVNSFFKKIFKP